MPATDRQTSDRQNTADHSSTPPTPDRGAADVSPAWSKAELARPHANQQKADKVRRMFAAIAPSYDLNNRLHSLWLDQSWRKIAVRIAGVKPNDHVLDVACGTGDLTQAFAKSGAARVVGADFTAEMLDQARAKQAKLEPNCARKIEYLQADAMALPFADQSFDIVSIAFGIRNVAEPARAIAEFHRVLRPNGRLVILEFDQPNFAIGRWINRLYCARIMPLTATMISRDTSGAYKYLPASVGTFMSRGEMLQALREAGFTSAECRSLTMGICACYRAVRPVSGR
ncbi:MAG: bifunctional demethylmenaquinone methyltransferase/2-methoxy-6-polyprenyl-1,4-benzoquinol methylase UbiE [Phycisphaerales bacterium]|nr:MAG: bifunctional demethylmenaquinone methyltransferase/2-methoxy-6-polyprenyl-1,4-benzoquinol methylase UbiE [Phycisphaerales bacterium]